MPIRRKTIAALIGLALCGILGLATAGAYTVPGKLAGSPGGPCTSATGGNGTSQRDAFSLCNRFAAFTGEELALKEMVFVTMHFPGAGHMKCLADGSAPPNQSQRLGSATLSLGHRGAENMFFIFGTAGSQFLAANTKVGVTITVSCTWFPNGGSPQTSVGHVVTSH